MIPPDQGIDPLVPTVQQLVLSGPAPFPVQFYFAETPDHMMDDVTFTSWCWAVPPVGALYRTPTGHAGIVSKVEWSTAVEPRAPFTPNVQAISVTLRRYTAADGFGT
jgi:hypothetical protein